jgi:hypothetical protein
MKALPDRMLNERIKYSRKYAFREKKKASGTLPPKPQPQNFTSLKKYFGRR